MPVYLIVLLRNPKRLDIFLENQSDMYDHGIFSLIPPVLAIVLAIRTRQVFVSLLFDIWLGWVIIDDYHLMEQVIINLIRNSLDASRGKEDSFIRLQAEMDDGQPAIKVVDNGKGILPDFYSSFPDFLIQTPGNNDDLPSDGSLISVNVSLSSVNDHSYLPGNSEAIPFSSLNINDSFFTSHVPQTFVSPSPVKSTSYFPSSLKVIMIVVPSCTHDPAINLFKSLSSWISD